MTNIAKQDRWPKRFDERFHIFALGEQFDVDAFLATSPLTPNSVWRQLGNGPTNGLEILLGDGAPIPLRKQEEIAIAYLSEHRDTLRNLAQFPGVEALNLGFVYLLPSSATGCCIVPSAELMLSALGASVKPVYYVTLEAQRMK